MSSLKKNNINLKQKIEKINENTSSINNKHISKTIISESNTKHVLEQEKEFNYNSNINFLKLGGELDKNTSLSKKYCNKDSISNFKRDDNAFNSDFNQRSLIKKNTNINKFLSFNTSRKNNLSNNINNTSISQNMNAITRTETNIINKTNSLKSKDTYNKENPKILKENTNNENLKKPINNGKRKSVSFFQFHNFNLKPAPLNENQIEKDGRNAEYFESENNKLNDNPFSYDFNNLKASNDLLINNKINKINIREFNKSQSLLSLNQAIKRLNNQKNRVNSIIFNDKDLNQINSNKQNNNVVSGQASPSKQNYHTINSSLYNSTKSINEINNKSLHIIPYNTMQRNSMNSFLFTFPLPSETIDKRKNRSAETKRAFKKQNKKLLKDWGYLDISTVEFIKTKLNKTYNILNVKKNFPNLPLMGKTLNEIYSDFISKDVIDVNNTHNNLCNLNGLNSIASEIHDKHYIKGNINISNSNNNTSLDNEVRNSINNTNNFSSKLKHINLKLNLKANLNASNKNITKTLNNTSNKNTSKNTLKERILNRQSTVESFKEIKFLSSYIKKNSINNNYTQSFSPELVNKIDKESSSDLKRLIAKKDTVISKQSFINKRKKSKLLKFNGLFTNFAKGIINENKIATTEKEISPTLGISKKELISHVDLGRKVSMKKSIHDYKNLTTQVKKVVNANMMSKMLENNRTSNSNINEYHKNSSLLNLSNYSNNKKTSININLGKNSIKHRFSSLNKEANDKDCSKSGFQHHSSDISLIPQEVLNNLSQQETNNRLKSNQRVSFKIDITNKNLKLKNNSTKRTSNTSIFNIQNNPNSNSNKREKNTLMSKSSFYSTNNFYLNNKNIDTDELYSNGFHSRFVKLPLNTMNDKKVTASLNLNCTPHSNNRLINYNNQTNTNLISLKNKISNDKRMSKFSNSSVIENKNNQDPKKNCFSANYNNESIDNSNLNEFSGHNKHNETTKTLNNSVFNFVSDSVSAAIKDQHQNYKSTTHAEAEKHGQINFNSLQKSPPQTLIQESTKDYSGKLTSFNAKIHKKSNKLAKFNDELINSFGINSQNQKYSGATNINNVLSSYRNKESIDNEKDEISEIDIEEYCDKTNNKILAITKDKKNNENVKKRVDKLNEMLCDFFLYEYDKEGKPTLKSYKENNLKRIIQIRNAVSKYKKYNNASKIDDDTEEFRNNKMELEEQYYKKFRGEFYSCLSNIKTNFKPTTHKKFNSIGGLYFGVQA